MYNYLYQINKIFLSNTNFIIAYKSIHESMYTVYICIHTQNNNYGLYHNYYFVKVLSCIKIFLTWFWSQKCDIEKSGGIGKVDVSQKFQYLYISTFQCH